METETIQIDELVHDPQNPRAHPTANIEAIRGSLNALGQRRPIIIDENNRILAGNGVVMAARQLGWNSVSAVRFNDMDEADKQRFAIADNRTSELSEWEDNLSDLLQELESDDAELDRMLGELGREAEAETARKSGGASRNDDDVIPAMELQPHEHYDYVVVLATNPQEWNNLAEALDLQTRRFSKTRVGVGRAVRASKLLELIHGNATDRDPEPGEAE